MIIISITYDFTTKSGGIWSAVFKQEIQPILQPFFAGEYTTYRCDVKYEE